MQQGSFFLPVRSAAVDPEYQPQSEKVAREFLVRRTPSEVLDIVATIIANLVALWLTVVVLVHGVSHLHTLGYLVVFWALLAYLVLPRWHQTLTSLYVPDYYIGRTRTQDGLLGDPINLAVTGSAERIHEVMQAAGWTLADPITWQSSWRIVMSSLRRQSYPSAPVSPLFLFKNQQDFAYQQEVKGNPARRHHVRFWRCPDGWLLPGGRRVDWLAGGTYDRSVGLSLFTLQVTHKIDRNVDIERDYIIDSVRHAEPSLPVEVLPQFTTSYHHRNGGGDQIETDGALPILHVGGSVEDSLPPSLPKRPMMLWLGLGLLVLSLVVTAVSFGTLVFLNYYPDPEIFSEGPQALVAGLATTGMALALQLVALLLWWGTFRGYHRARIGLLVLSLASTIESLVRVSFGETPLNLPNITVMVLNVMVVLSLSSDSVRAFVESRSARRHAGQGPESGMEEV